MSNSAEPWTHLFVCNSPNSIQTLSNILPYWTTAQILIQSYLVESSRNSTHRGLACPNFPNYWEMLMDSL